VKSYHFPGMNKTYTWSRSIPVMVHAMALSKDTLFVAGPPDVVPSDDPLGAYQDRKGCVVKAFSRTDGNELAEYRLHSAPAFDGMAITDDSLYLSLKNGDIVCFRGY